MLRLGISFYDWQRSRIRTNLSQNRLGKFSEDFWPSLAKRFHAHDLRHVAADRLTILITAIRFRTEYESASFPFASISIGFRFGVVVAVGEKQSISFQ